MASMEYERETSYSDDVQLEDVRYPLPKMKEKEKTQNHINIKKKTCKSKIRSTILSHRSNSPSETFPKQIKESQYTQTSR